MEEKTQRKYMLIIAVLCVLIIIGFVIILMNTVFKEKSDAANEIEYTYKSDRVQKYREYLYIEDGSEDIYLMLVNRESNIGEYKPEYLVSTGSVTDVEVSRYDYYVEARALKALTAMFLEAETDGIVGIRVTSAYRSYEKQVQLFDEYCKEEMAADPSLTRSEAEAIVKRYSMPAGCSEHQTGLCVDLYDINSPSTVLKKSFANTKAGKWLAENCHRFGFVLRFEEDKEKYTGIDFEPWHFRYVGIEAAAEMKERGMCLEEYKEYLGK